MRGPARRRDGNGFGGASAGLACQDLADQAPESALLSFIGGGQHRVDAAARRRGLGEPRERFPGAVEHGHRAAGIRSYHPFADAAHGDGQALALFGQGLVRPVLLGGDLRAETAHRANLALLVEQREFLGDKGMFAAGQGNCFFKFHRAAARHNLRVLGLEEGGHLGLEKIRIAFAEQRGARESGQALVAAVHVNIASLGIFKIHHEVRAVQQAGKEITAQVHGLFVFFCISVIHAAPIIAAFSPVTPA